MRRLYNDDISLLILKKSYLVAKLRKAELKPGGFMVGQMKGDNVRSSVVDPKKKISDLDSALTSLLMLASDPTPIFC